MSLFPTGPLRCHIHHSHPANPAAGIAVVGIHVGGSGTANAGRITLLMAPVRHLVQGDVRGVVNVLPASRLELIGHHETHDVLKAVGKCAREAARIVEVGYHDLAPALAIAAQGIHFQVGAHPAAAAVGFDVLVVERRAGIAPNRPRPRAAGSFNRQ